MAAPTANIDADLWERIVDLTQGRLLIPQTEVCRAFGITSETLTQEIEAGRLRYVLVGSRRKFKPSDLANYLQQQERGACDENHSSNSGQAETAGIVISNSEVVDFATALARTPAKPPRPKPPSSSPPPRLVETRLRRPARRRSSRSAKPSGAIGKPAVRMSGAPATSSDTAKP